ncbi:Putative storage protein LPV, partial [Phytophthora palmivora]
MKSPTNYGSENEETRFIRRVAAPDRPNNKRRQKKRLAIAGATLGLLAASAGVGYTVMKNAGSTSAVKTAKLEASMSNEARAFISKLGDAFHPNFNKIDQDNDGKLSKSEILADLTEKEMVDVDKVKASDLPEDIKKNVVALLEGKLKSDGDCAKQALDQRQVPVTRADHDIFYYMLDVFCPRVTIAVTPPDQEEEAGYGGSNQQTVEIPTPDGGTTEVILVGEPEDGKQTIAIPDNDGGYTTTEVRSIETPTGEQKILIPNAEGDITPVVVPEAPTEVIEQAEQTGEQAQVVNVVTDNGETEQVIIQGEPDEHGEVTVQIPDNEGGYIETTAKVEETSTGEQKIVV